MIEHKLKILEFLFLEMDFCSIIYGDTHQTPSAFFFFASFYIEVYINKKLLLKVRALFSP